MGVSNKWYSATIALGLVITAASAQAKPLTLDFDNGKGTLNPACTGSASMASCFVNPADPGSTWSDNAGFQTSTLKAFGKATVSELGDTLKDRIRLTHDYDGNGKKDPTDTNKITETLKSLTYSSDEMLSITNDASITGRDGLFSYTTDFEINPAGSSPWITVASFTGDGTDVIDLATFSGLDLTDGETFATRIVTTADYDYTGINCVDDGCTSVFRDKVTANFVPEPPSAAIAGAGLGLMALTFAWRRRRSQVSRVGSA